MSQSQIVKSKKLSWINIVNASEKEISYLTKKFNYKAADLQDSYAHKHAQRPKIYFRPKYIFLVLLFPVYNPKTREIKSAEIDFLISKNHLITLHNNKLKPIKEFFNTCLNDKNEKDLYLNEDTIMLLYEILNRLYDSIYPMLDHISMNINVIEKNIFKEKEREMVKEVLIIKINIVYFRKIMQVHKNILKKLIVYKSNFIDNKEIKIFFTELIDTSKNIWDLLENYQQTIDALEDTNNALVTFKLNDIMRTLTIFSVIVFPLTLMAAVFGMNVKDMPIINTAFDFWKILGLMLIATIAMYTYFRHKKWI